MKACVGLQAIIAVGLRAKQPKSEHVEWYTQQLTSILEYMLTMDLECKVGIT